MSHTKAELVSSIREHATNNATYAIKASSVVGNNLWLLMTERDNPEKVWITLCKMDQSNFNGIKEWTYKAIDESSFPYSYDCPVRFLDQSTNELGERWRECARLTQETEELTKGLVKPGLKITVGAAEYTLVESLGTKGWRVNDQDGVAKRMPAKMLKEMVADISFEAGRNQYEKLTADRNTDVPLHWLDEEQIPMEFDRLPPAARAYFINAALGGQVYKGVKQILRTNHDELAHQERCRAPRDL